MTIGVDDEPNLVAYEIKWDLANWIGGIILGVKQ
jgi:hypothetical protein